MWVELSSKVNMAITELEKIVTQKEPFMSKQANDPDWNNTLPIIE